MEIKNRAHASSDNDISIVSADLQPSEFEKPNQSSNPSAIEINADDVLQVRKSTSMNELISLSLSVKAKVQKSINLITLIILLSLFKFMLKGH